MSNESQPWSKEELEKLASLRDQGVPYNQIARELKRSNDACRKAYSTLKIFKQIVVAPTVTTVATGPKRWSNDDLQTLYTLRRIGTPYYSIARQLERTMDSCKSKYVQTDWKSMGFPDEEQGISDRIYETNKEVVRQQMLNAADRRNETQRMKTDILGDRISLAVKACPPIPLTVWNPNRNKASLKKKEEDVMLVLSDIHVGAEHFKEETGGISEYNREILNIRLTNLQYAVRDIVELHSNIYDLPHLHIACLGDVVAGDNSSGEWSQNYIGMPIVDQVIDGYSKIRDMIAYWLTIFPEITFYGVRGNHGRVGEKNIEKDYSNFDYLCYRFLKEVFKDNPRIHFVVPKTWWILANIRGWKFLMVHGDDLRGGSFPIKQLENFEAKMAAIIKEIPHYTLAGHFHNSCELSTNQGSLIINGSFVGGDVYSIKTIHKNARPEQTIFGINTTNGKTWKYNIDLDKAREPD